MKTEGAVGECSSCWQFLIVASIRFTKSVECWLYFIFFFIVSNNFKKLAQPLSQEEIEELDDFLMSDKTSDETMPTSALDGYLTAVASGPAMLKPSEWMPGIWGPTEDHHPEFETMAQAERITELIMRQYNDVTKSLLECPETLEPIFDDFYFQLRFYIDGEM